jgi:curli biogenesis system outer membrane secretion channel CsgG
MARLIASVLMVALLAVALVLAGCSSTSSTAGETEVAKNVGKYPPPPGGNKPFNDRPKVGVPDFEVVSADQSVNRSRMSQIAAEQLVTLGAKANRFRMIERSQLEQLLKEQQLEGIVKADEMAQMGQVSGVDYLLIGQVTAFRVKNTGENNEFALGRVGSREFNLGALTVENEKDVVEVEVGVDIRLVQPSSGAILATGTGTVTRKDTVEAMGLGILSGSARAGADQEIDSEQLTVLRLALDQAMRNMLPDVDAALGN